MNVAMVALSAEESGSARATGEVEPTGVDDLSAALVAAGHAVTVFAPRGDAALPDRWTTARGVRIEAIDAGAAKEPADALAAMRARLASVWFGARADVVHAHSRSAGRAAAPVASSFGIPLVQTFEFAPAPRPETEDVPVLRAATRIIATSSAQVFALLKLGAYPSAIKLIPAGVDLQMFTPLGRSGQRSAGCLRVVTLSGLQLETGLGDVIAALARAGDVDLAIGEFARAATSGAERDALERVAEEHGVRRRIVFHGPLERGAGAAFLRGADVLVCAPWYDSSGTFVLEAMACGIPVIASAVGSHVDVVADGISGILVAPRSPGQLAYAIDALRADDAQRERYARRGLERARARYGWTRIAAELVEVYRGAVAAGEPARRSAGTV